MRDIWSLNYRWELNDNTWTNVPLLDNIDDISTTPYNVFDINEDYFKYQKCLSGITYQYVNQLDNIYEKNLMVGTNYCIYCMYNEFDIIKNFMVNLYQVDICCTGNTDLTQRYFQLDNAYLKTKHRVLLVGQTDKTQNDIYNVDSRGYLILSDELSNTGRTWRYKAYVKLGNNKGKQFHLKNIGDRFPLTGEKKDFIEGHGYIIKNYFNYNLYSKTVPGLIFTDYEIARISVNRNMDSYTGFTMPMIQNNGWIKIKYHSGSTSYAHDPSKYTYLIKVTSLNNYTYTGNTGGVSPGNIINSGTTLIAGPSSYVKITDTSVFSATNINDYIKLTISGSTTGTTNLELKTFVKNKTSPYIILNDYIPDDIINYYNTGTTEATYTFKNLMYTSDDKDDVKETMLESYFAKYFDIQIQSVFTGGTWVDLYYIFPKLYEYDRYFDYDGLSFDFDANSSSVIGVIYGSILAGAVISEDSNPNLYKTTSDHNGNYSLALPQGSHNITVTYPYYQDSGATVVLSDNNPVVVDFQMIHEIGVITGITIDHMSGLGIENVQISTGSTYCTLTDSNGEFTINGVLSGPGCSVSASLTGYVGSSQTVEVPISGGEVGVYFNLMPLDVTGTLSGLTTDLNTLDIISGATITTGGKTGKSGTDGIYIISSVPATTSISVNCSATDYLPVTSSITVPYHGTSALDFQLEKNIGTLTGKTTTIYDGSNITGVLISLNSVDKDITDANGYNITGITAGSGYSASASKTGWVTNTVSGISIVKSTTTEQNFIMTPVPYIGSVSGVTTSSLGGFVENAQITSGSSYVTTNSNGEYTMTNIPVGSRTFVCSATNYNSSTSALSITYNPSLPVTQALDFVLTPSNGDLSGTVTNYYSSLLGTPVNGATIVVTYTGGSKTTTSSIDGSYTITDIPSGSISVSCSKTYYEDMVKTDTMIPAGVTMNFNIYYWTGTCTGTLNDNCSTALASKTITIDGNINAPTTTNGSGVYTTKVLYGTRTISCNPDPTTYTPYSGTVDIPHDTTATKNITLTKLVTTLTIYTYSEDLGDHFVPFVDIYIDSVLYETTDSTGNATIIDAPVGSGRVITAMKTGFSSGPQTIDLVSCITSNCIFNMIPD